MPVWLLRLIPYGAAAIALAGAVWWIDSSAVDRTKAEQAAIEKRLGEQIAVAVSDIDKNNAIRLTGIRNVDRTILQPTITREIASDPRYSSSDCSLTPGMFDALNRARALAGVAGTDRGTVPTAPAAD